PHWHPYHVQYARALERYGITVEPGDEFSDRELIRAGGAVDVIHLHWLEHLWCGPSFFGRMRILVGLRRYLRLANRLGYRIFWSVHNHASHEGGTWGDGLGF